MAPPKKDIQIDWEHMSLDYLVQRVLEDQLVFGVDSGIRTNDLAAALMKMGHPQKDHGKLSRELNAYAKKMTGTKENTFRRDPKDETKAEKFTGCTWVGSLVSHEPWNMHIWHLPMWTDVNEVGWTQTRAGDGKTEFSRVNV